MSGPLRDLELRLDGLSLRERALILLAALGVLFAAWDLTVLQRIESDVAQRGSLREQLERRSAELAASRDALESLLVSDPHAEKRRRQSDLRLEIERVDELLRYHTGALVPPEEMVRLLRSLLATRPAIHVVSLEALGAEPLVAEAGTRPLAPGAELPVYKHAMRIELRAGFEETHAFLREMEQLPWSFFWDQLHYEVTDYPEARVSLVVYTLSSREGWIGV